MQEACVTMKGPNLAWEGWENIQAMDYEENGQRSNYPQKRVKHMISF